MITDIERPIKPQIETRNAQSRLPSFFKEEDMGKRRGQRQGYLRAEHGSWLLTYRIYLPTGRSQRETVAIGPATGSGKLTEKQAERVAWDHYLSKVDLVAQQPRALMTVADFWTKHYQPAANLCLKKAAREQYFSLYKRWIEPVIGRKRLATLETSDVEMAIARAIEEGMSPSTTRHIRKVISAVFTKAKKLRIASGDNPAALADLPPARAVRQKVALSVEQMCQLLAVLVEPLHTMVLAAVLTSCNVSELCGLCWKHVNLTPEWITFEDHAIPPFTLVVRQHFSRGETGSLKTGNRKRDIPLTEALVAALAQLKQRPKFTGPEDVIFASRRGTPISENNSRRRVLNPLAEMLGVTRLSWHVFRYSHATFTEQAGMPAKDRQMLMGHGSLDQTDRYTVADHERIRSGLERVAGRILPAKQKVQ